MARKYSKHGPREANDAAEETPDAPPPPDCWLCGRTCGESVVLHHPVPKSRGGRDTVPMHPICQQTLIAHFTNSELERFGMDVEAILADPAIAKFVDWVAKKDPEFNAPIPKKRK